MSSFILKKEKTIASYDQILPPSWIRVQQDLDLTNLVYDANSDRIYRTESTGNLRNRIVDTIDASKDIICVSTFLIADNSIINAMLRASDRHVRVYMLTASETQLKEPKPDNEFEAERLQEHINLLGKLAGRVLVRTGENLHSKFVLVDPNTSNAQGFLLTANLTSEALTRNPELGVKLDQAEVYDLFKQFTIGFWEESTAELLEPGSLNQVQKNNDMVLAPPSQLPCTTSKLRTLKDAVETLIESARTEIIISTYGIDLEQHTTKKLVNALKSGKRVTLLARPRQNKTTMNALITLSEAGAQIRGHPWLHAKCVLADFNHGWSGLVMTSNIEENGMEKGFETGVLLQEEDTIHLHNIIDKWWRYFPYQLFTRTRLGDIEGEALLWHNDSLNKVILKKSGEEHLGNFEAKTFDEMHTLTPNLALKPPQGDILYHEYTLRWTISPPRLPSGAERVHGDSDLPIYRQGKDTYLVVQHESQMTQARKMAAELGAKIVTK